MKKLLLLLSSVSLCLTVHAANLEKFIVKGKIKKYDKKVVLIDTGTSIVKLPRKLVEEKYGEFLSSVKKEVFFIIDSEKYFESK